MLGAIGLDEGHESAYRALVAAGAAELPELARRLSVAEPELERALGELERRGLAARSPARPGRWTAAPPGIALGALLTRQREELARAEQTAARLVEEYRARRAEPDPRDLVEIVVGEAAVAQRRTLLELGARSELCALLSGAPAPGSAGQPGVVRRFVAEREALGRTAALAGLTAAAGRTGSVRMVERVPGALLIADRSLALAPLTLPPAVPAALVVRDSGLLDTLTWLFETVWRQALPLRGTHEGVDAGNGRDDGGRPRPTADPDGPDATDLEILTLLLAGLTDASVAKQLDLGLRTVQRRVAGLMERAGVATRLQLGWRACERGWVTRTPPPG